MVAGALRRNGLLGWLVALGVAAGVGCVTLGPRSKIVEPPQFERVPGRPAELRLTPSAGDGATGGATVRLWLKVRNPNTFPLTMSRLETTLVVEGTRAATEAFPLGLPLAAGEEKVVPIELAIGPGLRHVLPRTLTGGLVDYRLDGTVAVDAGRWGRPVFGPLTLSAGSLGGGVPRMRSRGSPTRGAWRSRGSSRRFRA